VTSFPWAFSPVSVKVSGYRVQMGNLGFSAMAAVTLATCSRYLGPAMEAPAVQSAADLGLALLKELGSLGLLTLVLWKIGPAVLRSAGEAHRVEVAAMAKAIEDLKEELARLRVAAHDSNNKLMALLWAIDPQAGRMAMRKPGQQHEEEPPSG